MSLQVNKGIKMLDISLFLKSNILKLGEKKETKSLKLD
jgi:hypothetical protein